MYLDMKTFGMVLYYKLKHMSFFNRFSKEVLLENLSNAKVEYFKK